MPGIKSGVHISSSRFAQCFNTSICEQRLVECFDLPALTISLSLDPLSHLHRPIQYITDLLEIIGGQTAGGHGTRPNPHTPWVQSTTFISGHSVLIECDINSVAAH